MRSRIFVGGVLLIALVAVGRLGASVSTHVGLTRQWTVTNFPDAVLVNGRLIMGPVLIVHDDAKMANGEACTTFYRFDPARGVQEELVSFHCTPKIREVVDKTTFTTVSMATGCKKLIEYQIAGDSEAHGVPSK
jgi:hypothetical protein